MEILSEILGYLVHTYRNKGFDVEPEAPPVAFVGDIVLANVHFKLGWRVDRNRLRDVMNQDRGAFVASYEPLVRDVSVSIKHFEDAPLPNDGAVYPMWTAGPGPDTAGGSWSTVRYQDIMRLVPHATIKRRPRCHTFRVFATGSVVQVGRWPDSMRQVYDHFQHYMARVRNRVVDPGSAHQRTLRDMWQREGGGREASKGDPPGKRIKREEDTHPSVTATAHHHHGSPDHESSQRAADQQQVAAASRALHRGRHHKAAPTPRVVEERGGPSSPGVALPGMDRVRGGSSS